jgi:hypothetical protein
LGIERHEVQLPSAVERILRVHHDAAERLGALTGNPPPVVHGCGRELRAEVIQAGAPEQAVPSLLDRRLGLPRLIDAPGGAPHQTGSIDEPVEHVHHITPQPPPPLQRAAMIVEQSFKKFIDQYSTEGSRLTCSRAAA